MTFCALHRSGKVDRLAGSYLSMMSSLGLGCSRCLYSQLHSLASVLNFHFLLQDLRKKAYRLGWRPQASLDRQDYPNHQIQYIACNRRGSSEAVHLLYATDLESSYPLLLLLVASDLLQRCMGLYLRSPPRYLNVLESRHLGRTVFFLML